MRVAILGVTGMIGHRLLVDLQQDMDVYGISHGSLTEHSTYGIFNLGQVIPNVDVRGFDYLTGVLHAIRPDVVLNCVGVTKRKPLIENAMAAIELNALFPHRLVAWCRSRAIRVLHFSTDCVFDGQEGNYLEDSPTTARDMYGRTKALGEVRCEGALTIRSSFIGMEVSSFSELLEWFLNQEGKSIRGYRQAFYTGLSTLVMARVVKRLILEFPDLSGLYNLAIPMPISKYDLLCLARDAFGVNVRIEPDDDFSSRPTLNGERLRDLTGIEVPRWPEMMSELAKNRAFYDLRKTQQEKE